MKQFSSLIKRVSNVFDKIAGAFIVLVMVLVVSNVIMRVVFNSPIKGTYELIGLLTAVAVSMGLAYCAFQKGHIAVDYLVEYLPKKAQLIVNILNNFIAICFFSTSTWYLAKYANSMMKKGLVTATAEIPIYPFIYLVACGFLVFSLVLTTALRQDLISLKQESFVSIKISKSISEESI